MTIFFQSSAAVLISIVLILSLAKQGKETGLLISIAVCCMLAVVSIQFLEPIFDFLTQLESMSDLNSNMLEILLKVVGIGLISEITALVCTDTGNGSIGKMLQLLGNAVMLWLSIPLFQTIIDLTRRIMEGI